jgi:hypothetical protein
MSVNLLTMPRYEFSDFVNIGPGAFGTSDREMVCWEGQNYVRQRPSLLVRLHNWIVWLRSSL